MSKWYAGVTHCHTTRSDGKYAPEKIVSMAEERKLDFLMITDHNKILDRKPESRKVTVIYGTELTKHGGHSNFWGVQAPFDDFECETIEDLKEKIATAKQRGATTSMNHPLCTGCPWRWEKLPELFDCVEVWNSPQHIDNMRCTEWWADELRKDKKIPVVGGSDYHEDYYVTDLMINPVTYVYAESADTDDILRAIREGKTTICAGIGTTFIEIFCGDKMLGDTVKVTGGEKARVTVKGLKKGHTLKVIGSTGLIYEHTANKKEDLDFTVDVGDNTFLYALSDYKVAYPVRLGHNLIMKKRNHCRLTDPVPRFIYAQTGAIYFEK
ncbi:MAG: CehA/McbA family metallohydrolase [Clostridia bacterium]|nr:CehA/McbA family metallohydrolase [Clostridia bacterium]